MEEPSHEEGLGPPTALDELLKRTVRGPGDRPTWALRNPRLRDVVGLLAVVVVAGVVGLLGWRWLERPAPIDERMPSAAAGQDRGGADRKDGGAGSVSSSTEEPEADAGPEALVVHVAGSVARPGVVELPAESRVGEAITAAGGLAGAADVGRINLAAPLVDGARVYVPVLGEQVPGELTFEVPPGGGTDSGGTAALVDINSADGEELETLPGVGPATAAAIIDHRERNGSFRSVEELLDVRGIGDAKLEALADLVTAG